MIYLPALHLDLLPIILYDLTLEIAKKHSSKLHFTKFGGHYENTDQMKYRVLQYQSKTPTHWFQKSTVQICHKWLSFIRNIQSTKKHKLIQSERIQHILLIMQNETLNSEVRRIICVSWLEATQSIFQFCAKCDKERACTTNNHPNNSRGSLRSR